MLHISAAGRRQHQCCREEMAFITYQCCREEVAFVTYQCCREDTTYISVLQEGDRLHISAAGRRQLTYQCCREETAYISVL